MTTTSRLFLAFVLAAASSVVTGYTLPVSVLPGADQPDLRACEGLPDAAAADEAQDDRALEPFVMDPAVSLCADKAEGARVCVCVVPTALMLKYVELTTGFRPEFAANGWTSGCGDCDAEGWWTPEVPKQQ